MFDAILNDQGAFVSLFAENGFDFESFLTVHTLEKLYTACMQKKVSATEHAFLIDISRLTVGSQWQCTERKTRHCGFYPDSLNRYSTYGISHGGSLTLHEKALVKTNQYFL